MNGKHQASHTSEIAASRNAVWAVIADDRLLPQWVPVVETPASMAPAASARHAPAASTSTAGQAP
jgi:uncharacterized protein YndB with AHSA1/START domain